jgi:hypothetical protein
MKRIYKGLLVIIAMIFLFPFAAAGQGPSSELDGADREDKTENGPDRAGRALYPSPELNSAYLGIGIGAVPFSDKIRDEMSIGEGRGLSFDFGYAFWDRLALNAGIGILSAKDKTDGFTQQVCPGFTGGFCDDPDEKKSSINIYTFSVETGLQHRKTVIHPKMFLLVGGFVGYRGLLVSREITRCSDCKSEGLYVAGAYLTPLIGLGFNFNGRRDFYLYGRYENFISGDEMDPALWIGLASSAHF